MKKRIISILFILTLTISLFGIVANAETGSGGGIGTGDMYFYWGYYVKGDKLCSRLVAKYENGVVKSDTSFESVAKVKEFKDADRLPRCKNQWHLSGYQTFAQAWTTLINNNPDRYRGYTWQKAGVNAFWTSHGVEFPSTKDIREGGEYIWYVGPGVNGFNYSNVYNPQTIIAPGPPIEDKENSSIIAQNGVSTAKFKNALTMIDVYDTVIDKNGKSKKYHYYQGTNLDFNKAKELYFNGGGIKDTVIKSNDYDPIDTKTIERHIYTRHRVISYVSLQKCTVYINKNTGLIDPNNIQWGNSGGNKILANLFRENEKY